MTIWMLAFVLGVILVGGAAFLHIANLLRNTHGPYAKKNLEDYRKNATKDIEHIFNDEFREELRNRGRLHFEKILGENAMFLQQDLRLTTAQLNDYMKGEISKELKEAFANYQQAIADARQLAVEAIEKTKTTIEEQRELLTVQLENEVTEEKVRRVKRFDDNMAEIVNHYVLDAIGNQIDLKDQLEYILGELEHNKKSILEDMVNGA
jgi:hypothetical protein